jgi:hypothetical protein
MTVTFCGRAAATERAMTVIVMSVERTGSRALCLKLFGSAPKKEVLGKIADRGAERRPNRLIR